MNKVTGLAWPHYFSPFGLKSNLYQISYAQYVPQSRPWHGYGEDRLWIWSLWRHTQRQVNTSPRHLELDCNQCMGKGSNGIQWLSLGLCSNLLNFDFSSSRQPALWPKLNAGNEMNQQYHPWQGSYKNPVHSHHNPVQDWLPFFHSQPSNIPIYIPTPEARNRISIC